MAAIALWRVANLLPITALTLKTTDAAQGVSNRYDPEGFRAPGVTRWVDRVGGIAVGYPSITMSVRPPTKDSRIHKVTLKLMIPTLEQTSPSTSSGIQPAPTKAYDCGCVMEFMLPERSSLAEREKLLSQVVSLFATTINASDDDPTTATGSPLLNAVRLLEDVY